MSSIIESIVIVDDDELIRFTLQKKLSRLGYNVISLDKAEDAIYLLKNKEQTIDLIITDIKLRKMDGIEFLQYINAMESPVPVLILSGEANIEDAIRALRFGACDFIRKPFDINEVISTVRGVLRRKHEERLAVNFGQYIIHDRRSFSMPMDMAIANHLSFKLTKNLPAVGLCNQATAENISLALREAITNAMFHGNLELSSTIRESGGIRSYNEEIERRLSDEHYSKRRVKIEYELTHDYVEYTIEDEGPGFDVKSLPDPRDPDNFFKKSGRGILIIQIHFDDVEWNDAGNRIRMRKNRVER